MTTKKQAQKHAKYTPMALDQMTFVLSHKNGVNRGVIRASPTGYVCSLAIMGKDNKIHIKITPSCLQNSKGTYLHLLISKKN